MCADSPGDPDLPHTYTFIPDIGENLVRLGERDDALGHAWHLPSPETRTTREIVALVYDLKAKREIVRVRLPQGFGLVCGVTLRLLGRVERGRVLAW